jgi:hypothetical protein
MVNWSTYLQKGFPLFANVHCTLLIIFFQFGYFSIKAEYI